jgi:two-component sensor histidine kinase
MQAGAYLGELAELVVGNFPGRTAVRVEKELPDFSLASVKLQPLGVIVNEILTNAMKYAFVGRKEGRIVISASRREGRVRVSVGDDGCGLPESMDPEASPGFGLTLINSLAAQLGGEARVERGGGTRFIIEFPG